MLGRKDGLMFECVLVDINTQEDYCDPLGSSPVGNAVELMPALRRVMAWTKRNFAPMVSSIESHRAAELSDSGTPICCLDGSMGQRKVPFTLLPRRAVVEIDNTLAVPINFFRRNQQVIFRKRTDDLLANPKADRLLTQLPVAEFIVIGAGLETSVKAAVLALLTRNKRVTVVSDACGYWHQGTSSLALRQMEAKGANIITVDELLTRKLDRKMKSCYHPHRIRVAPSELARQTQEKTSPAKNTKARSRSHDAGVTARSGRSQGNRVTRPHPGKTTHQPDGTS
jgi:nicotinamidase-related amidase